MHGRKQRPPRKNPRERLERRRKRRRRELPSRDAVTALRLATNGAIAAGPVLFETLDLRPYGIRPVLPIAVRIPGFFDRVNPLWPPYLLRDCMRIAEYHGIDFG